MQQVTDYGARRHQDDAAVARGDHPELPKEQQQEHGPEVEDQPSHSPILRSAARSASVNRPYAASVIAAMTLTEAHSSGIWKFCMLLSTTTPNPEGAPNHSPTMAPIIALAAAIFMPLKIDGTAAIASSFVSRCQRSAPSVVNTSSRRGLAPRRPTPVEVYSKKKTGTAARAAGVLSRPAVMMRIGPRAMTGSALTSTDIRSRPPRNNGTRWASNATAVPRQVPTA